MLDLALFEGRDLDGHVQETRRAPRKRNSIRSTPRPRSRRHIPKRRNFGILPPAVIEEMVPEKTI